MKYQYKKNKLNMIFTLFLLMIGFGQSVSLHAEPLMVEEKVIVSAPAKAVWALIGGFHVLDRWHPAVTQTTLIGTGKNIGDIRDLTLDNGQHVIERLEMYDETAMAFQYEIMKSPLPIADYHAVITVESVERNKAEVTWRSNFTAVGASDEEAKSIISGIYVAGLNSLMTLYK